MLRHHSGSSSGCPLRAHVHLLFQQHVSQHPGRKVIPSSAASPIEQGVAQFWAGRSAARWWWELTPALLLKSRLRSCTVTLSSRGLQQQLSACFRAGLLPRVASLCSGKPAGVWRREAERARGGGSQVGSAAAATLESECTAAAHCPFITSRSADHCTGCNSVRKCQTSSPQVTITGCLLHLEDVFIKIIIFPHMAYSWEGPFPVLELHRVTVSHWKLMVPYKDCSSL